MMFYWLRNFRQIFFLQTKFFSLFIFQSFSHYLTSNAHSTHRANMLVYNTHSITPSRAFTALRIKFRMEIEWWKKILTALNFQYFLTHIFLMLFRLVDVSAAVFVEFLPVILSFPSVNIYYWNVTSKSNIEKIFVFNSSSSSLYRTTYFLFCFAKFNSNKPRWDERQKKQQQHQQQEVKWWWLRKSERAKKRSWTMRCYRNKINRDKINIINRQSHFIWLTTDYTQITNQ